MYSYCLVVALFCFFDFRFVLVLFFSLAVPFWLGILVRLCRYWMVHSSFVALSPSQIRCEQRTENKMCGFFSFGLASFVCVRARTRTYGHIHGERVSTENSNNEHKIGEIVFYFPILNLVELWKIFVCKIYKKFVDNSMNFLSSKGKQFGQLRHMRFEFNKMCLFFFAANFLIYSGTR